MTGIVGVLLLAWGITATVVAVQQRSGWTEAKRDLAATRAELTSTEADLEATEEDLVAMTDERDVLADELEALEVERAALDARLEEVADEKALAEDEREILRQVLAIAPEATEAMDLCADANLNVSRALVNFMSVYPYGTVYPVEAAIDTATTVCDQARSFAADLEAAVDQLT